MSLRVEMREGVLTGLVGVSISISLSFFLRSLARTLLVVDSYLATSFLSSFFFSCLGMLGGYSKREDLQLECISKLVGIFSLEVTPMKREGEMDRPIKLM